MFAFSLKWVMLLLLLPSSGSVTTLLPNPNSISRWKYTCVWAYIQEFLFETTHNKHYHLIWINTRTSSMYAMRSDPMMVVMLTGARVCCLSLCVWQNPLPLTIKPMHLLHFMMMVFRFSRCSYLAHILCVHDSACVCVCALSAFSLITNAQNVPHNKILSFWKHAFK